MIAGILLLAASWSQKLNMDQKLAALDWQRQSASKQALISKHQSAPHDTQQQDQTKHAAEIMALLNMPWDKLFSAIEQAYSRDIVLTSVTPNPQQKSLVIEGLATEISQAIDFSERLKSSQVLAEPHLTEEDWDEANQYFPQQFQINAKWNPAP